jgi:hypothetical protein
VVRKYFPLDKNYLLEEAQLALQDTLLHELVVKVKRQYTIRHNPLGLQDAFAAKIDNYKLSHIERLEEFYLTVAGIYRYKFGDNQLELLWGGETHFDKYKRDWQEQFERWMDELCSRDQFIQAVLDVTVFLQGATPPPMAENRMNFVMLHFFDLRIHKTKGLIAMKTG